MNLFPYLCSIKVKQYSPNTVIRETEEFHGAVTLSTLSAIFRHQYTNYDDVCSAVRVLFDRRVADDLFHVMRKRVDGASSPHVQSIYDIYLAQQREEKRAIA